MNYFEEEVWKIWWIFYSPLHLKAWQWSNSFKASFNSSNSTLRPVNLIWHNIYRFTIAYGLPRDFQFWWVICISSQGKEKVSHLPFTTFGTVFTYFLLLQFIKYQTTLPFLTKATENLYFIFYAFIWYCKVLATLRNNALHYSP